MLLDEIITLLGSTDGKLTDALIKTKILLHQIGKKELAEWVNLELNGYPTEMDVPSYRVLPSSVKANAANIAWMFQDQAIPTSHMGEFFKEHFLQNKVRVSLAICEEWTSKKEGTLTRTIPMEFNGKLSEPLEQGTNVINAWCVTPVHDVLGIITQVRSRLLDFLLELKSSIGDVPVTDETLKAEVAKIDATGLFQQAVFGGTTNIFLGNQNTQHLQINVKEGDINTLTQSLSEAGIGADDIAELQIAIEHDEKAGGKASFDGETGNWFTRMVSKAAKGGLKIGTDVASKVLVEALTKYIGQA